MNDAIVYIIVPVYNVEKYIKRCIFSLINQTYKNIKIVLVDDGSTDQSPYICDEFAKKYKRIYVIHKKNGGLSDARNYGLEFCFNDTYDIKKSYVSFVDSDDFVQENFIKKMIALCEKNNCQLAQCSYEKGNKNSFGPQLQNYNNFVVDCKTALLGYMLRSQCCAKIYKFELFINERFRLDVLNEDEFITYKIVYKCKNIAFTEEKLYYYYQRNGSIMNIIANKLKNNSHRNDWLIAHLERSEFFLKLNETELALRAYEKICSDIILRYTEQMILKESERDNSVLNGEYIRTYKYFYKKMMYRKIPFKRKMIYKLFYIFPYSAVIVSKLRPLRT